MVRSPFKSPSTNKGSGRASAVECGVVVGGASIEMAAIRAMAASCGKEAGSCWQLQLAVVPCAAFVLAALCIPTYTSWSWCEKLNPGSLLV